MNGIDTRVSAAIVSVLQSCGGRALGVRALTTYANAALAVPAAPEDIQRHIADLEGKGYVERVASPLNAADLQWRVTASGMTL